MKIDVVAFIYYIYVCVCVCNFIYSGGILSISISHSLLDTMKSIVDNGRDKHSYLTLISFSLSALISVSVLFF